MKNVTLAMILLLIVSLSAAIAQDTQLNNVQKRQSIRAASCVATTTATTVSSTTSRTCDGSGRGFGDGTKPRPQDGTGFGARSQNRQHRNARIGNGQGKGLGKNQADNERRKACNGTCASNTVTIENK